MSLGEQSDDIVLVGSVTALTYQARTSPSDLGNNSWGISLLMSPYHEGHILQLK